MITLAAKKRAEKGKNACKKIRAMGEMPGNIYGKQKDPVSIVFSEEKFLEILHKQEKVISIKYDEVEENVLIKELQFDALGDKILHSDFFRISMDEKISVKVPVQFLGIPKGTQKGGKLEALIRNVEIFALPNNIPSKLSVHIENLDLGESLKVKDLSLPEGTELGEISPDLPLVIVHQPKKQMAKDEAEEEEAEKSGE